MSNTQLGHKSSHNTHDMTETLKCDTQNMTNPCYTHYPSDSDPRDTRDTKPCEQSIIAATRLYDKPDVTEVPVCHTGHVTEIPKRDTYDMHGTCDTPLQQVSPRPENIPEQNLQDTNNSVTACNAIAGPCDVCDQNTAQLPPNNDVRSW